ncbi:MAG: glycosyltransferase family 2 protein [Eubacterium sp.]|nr:glycosyltransferase family 2 protein [Eubacterium sp.]
MKAGKLSVVVPCFNEAQVLSAFYSEIKGTLGRLKADFDVQTELIFVDDGSKDKTAEIIKAMHRDDPRVSYIIFSRNFGKEAAMIAGMRKATGDYVAVMDADLQDLPEMLIAMYESLIQEDCDCVAARRISRNGEPRIRSFLARKFYKWVNRLSKTEIVDGARDFRMMTRKMVDAVLAVKEYNRFSKGIFSWVGFETKWLPYENCERAAGKSKWSVRKLFLYSLDGIISYSTLPLAFASFAGLFFCLAAFVLICVIIAKTLIWGDPVAGYPSMICVIFFIGGLQLFCMGILGQYLSKVYLEVKGRPLYIIKEDS